MSINQQLKISKIEVHPSSNPSVVLHQILSSHNTPVAPVYNFEQLEEIDSMLK